MDALPVVIGAPLLLLASPLIGAILHIAAAAVLGSIMEVCGADRENVANVTDRIRSPLGYKGRRLLAYYAVVGVAVVVVVALRAVNGA